MPAARKFPITSSEEPAANPSRGPERTLTSSDLSGTNTVELADPIATDRDSAAMIWSGTQSSRTGGTLAQGG